jgi:hypothetical protein
LFRLPGSFLLRLAERQFLALLFQLPPRRTRLVYGLAPGERPFRRQAPDQAFTVCLPGMAEPARHFRKRARASTIRLRQYVMAFFLKNSRVQCSLELFLPLQKGRQQIHFRF